RPISFSVLFFFSSRRRHTSWPRDWSSDVCSSDLLRLRLRARARGRLHPEAVGQREPEDEGGGPLQTRLARAAGKKGEPGTKTGEIGRASCRERVKSSGVGAALEEKK